MNAIPNYAAIAEEIRGLESYLSSKIKGQHYAISRVCSILERGQFGLNPIEKPLGSFLFLGPTGVGKTGLTLEFARYLFGDNHVFRFDMSEFLHLDNVKLFIGDETGRIGRLGEVLARHQKGVLLFDETLAHERAQNGAAAEALRPAISLQLTKGKNRTLLRESRFAGELVTAEEL